MADSIFGVGNAQKFLECLALSVSKKVIKDNESRVEKNSVDNMKRMTLVRDGTIWALIKVKLEFPSWCSG